jgi:hypothetical protein
VLPEQSQHRKLHAPQRQKNGKIGGLLYCRAAVDEKSDPFSRRLDWDLRNTMVTLSRESRERCRRHGVSDRAFNQFWGATPMRASMGRVA